MAIGDVRRAMQRVGVAGAVMGALLGTSLCAQEPTSPGDTSPPPRPLIVTLWTAGAHNQPVATRVGYRYDRGLYLVGIQFRRTIAANADESLSLSHTVDVLPVIMTTGMRDYHVAPAPCGPRWPPGCMYDKTDTLPPHDTYGFGIAPLGFLSRWRATSLIGVQLRASGGVAYFQSPIPDPLACKFNFIADGSLLADVRVTHYMALVAGFRLNHISNGGRGRVNPGMDTRMLEAGLSLLTR